VVRKVNLEAKSTPIETLSLASVCEGETPNSCPLEVKPHPMETIYSCAHLHVLTECATFCTGPGNFITWQVWC